MDEIIELIHYHQFYAVHYPKNLMDKYEKPISKHCYFDFITFDNGNDLIKLVKRFYENKIPFLLDASEGDDQYLLYYNAEIKIGKNLFWWHKENFCNKHFHVSEEILNQYRIMDKI